MREHKTETLPKWAQEMIFHLHETISRKDDEIERLSKAHAVLTDREWFTVPGPRFDDSEDFRTLYLLNRNSVTAVCTLGRNDILLVGKNQKDNPTPF